MPSQQQVEFVVLTPVLGFANSMPWPPWVVNSWPWSNIQLETVVPKQSDLNMGPTQIDDGDLLPCGGVEYRK